MIGLSVLFGVLMASAPNSEATPGNPVPSCKRVVCTSQHQDEDAEAGERGNDHGGRTEGEGHGLETITYWVNACPGNEPTAVSPFGGGQDDCAQYRSCSQAGYVGIWVYQATWTSGAWGSFSHVASGCRDPADDPQRRARTVSEAQVIEELRAHALPRLQVITQPGKDDLILGLDTNVYTIATKQTGSLWFFDHTLQVDFETTPDRFHWTFGDEATTHTTEPGRPYPTMDITHTYEHTGQYSARVDVTWGHVRFKVAGGTWQASDQQPTTRGIPVALTVHDLHTRLGSSSR